ncbi:MAG: Reverse transcriptase (RNA-dependent DNA polymerase), partial [Candidatus Magasanikbacteria bacterium GW2011_GWA2_45_39]
ISLENLFDAWTEFKKEKANKKDVAEFEINLEDHVFKLHEDLKNGDYKHSDYVSFYVSDPKRRHIHKALVRDRLLHHAVHRIIEPEWNKIFVFDSWSSRKKKGIHGAVKRLQDVGLRLSQNHTRTLWVLKLDVRKFFDSVDHNVLLDILEKRTPDQRLMALFRDIIESFSPGLPLGNLTSQLFSNVYLDKLDQFVKHELKIIGYVRYADDFILIHPSRELLVDCLGKIKVFLRERLHLDVHPKKIVLKTYTGGIDYLGYVCFPHHRVLRTKTKRRMFRRVNDKNFTSYNGILKHCNSYMLKRELMRATKRNDYVDLAP